MDSPCAKEAFEQNKSCLIDPQEKGNSIQN